jgi:hypothetical protein
MNDMQPAFLSQSELQQVIDHSLHSYWKILMLQSCPQTLQMPQHVKYSEVIASHPVHQMNPEQL